MRSAFHPLHLLPQGFERRCKRLLVLLWEKGLRADRHRPFNLDMQQARLEAGDQHSHIHELFRLRIRAETSAPFV